MQAKLKYAANTIATVNTNVSTVSTNVSTVSTNVTTANTNIGASGDTASQTGTSLQAKTKYIANTAATMASDISTIKAAVSGGGATSLTVRITFASGLSGTFTLKGGGMNYSGTVNTSTPVDVVVSQPNTQYTIACGSYDAFVNVGASFGIYPVYMGTFSTTLANNTWANIAAASTAGVAPLLWNIGDTISFTAGSETLVAQIYDFNHDVLAAGGRAGITFGLQNCMATAQQLNTTNTNVNGFTGSAYYTTLQGTVLSSLPSALQTALKSVNKKTSAGNQSSTINTNSMKLFLFSEQEVFGTASIAVSGEGTQYPIFTDATSRIKKVGTTASSWWLRSPYAAGATNFCFVGTSGTAANGYAASNSYGVAFGFCV